MNKKIIIGIVVIIIVAVVSGLGYFLFNDDKNNTEGDSTTNNMNENIIDGNNQKDENDKGNKTISSNGKILVVYYSASGSTKKVAEKIAKNLDADLFEITPVDKYTSDDLNWSDENSRVSKEHDDESLRKVKLTATKVDNWEDYDTVLIGYPIWWGVAAWTVDTFVKNNDFTSKTVIPFCTSASSELGQSGKLLEDEAKGGDWLEGKRVSSGASNQDIKTWTDSLK